MEFVSHNTVVRCNECFEGLIFSVDKWWLTVSASTTASVIMQFAIANYFKQIRCLMFNEHKAN